MTNFDYKISVTIDNILEVLGKTGAINSDSPKILTRALAELAFDAYKKGQDVAYKIGYEDGYDDGYLEGSYDRNRNP